MKLVEISPGAEEGIPLMMIALRKVPDEVFNNIFTPEARILRDVTALRRNIEGELENETG